MMRSQLPSEIVFIESWQASEDFAIHPKGSQPKRTVVAPEPPPFDFLIGGHNYMFKTSKKEWQVNQIWSEVLAYEIGRICGVEVPPCFVAIDRQRNELGVLMEFFFGLPWDKGMTRLAHGADLLQRLLRDSKKGRPHPVRVNVRLGDKVTKSDTAAWWARTLVFDALIGNVDRHPENWGLLFSPGQKPHFAPLFDNGISLGYNLPENELARATTLERFLRKGRHHCSWSGESDTSASHVGLCRKFAEHYPGVRRHMRDVLNFDETQVSDALHRLTQFDVPYRFSPARAQFVREFLSKRRTELTEALRTQ